MPIPGGDRGDPIYVLLHWAPFEKYGSNLVTFPFFQGVRPRPSECLGSLEVRKIGFFENFIFILLNWVHVEKSGSNPATFPFLEGRRLAQGWRNDFRGGGGGTRPSRGPM